LTQGDSFVVQKNRAKHLINYKEKDYYFCSDGSKISFEKEPDKYNLLSQN